MTNVFDINCGARVNTVLGQQFSKWDAGPSALEVAWENLSAAAVKNRFPGQADPLSQNFSGVHILPNPPCDSYIL